VTASHFARSLIEGWFVLCVSVVGATIISAMYLVGRTDKLEKDLLVTVNGLKSDLSKVALRLEQVAHSRRVASAITRPDRLRSEILEWRRGLATLRELLKALEKADRGHTDKDDKEGDEFVSVLREAIEEGLTAWEDEEAELSSKPIEELVHIGEQSGTGVPYAARQYLGAKKTKDAEELIYRQIERSELSASTRAHYVEILMENFDVNESPRFTELIGVLLRSDSPTELRIVALGASEGLTGDIGLAEARQCGRF